jgi:hypothetical protein
MVDYLRTIRGDETSAMQATAALLPAIQFADKETLIPALSQLMQALNVKSAQSCWASRLSNCAVRLTSFSETYVPRDLSV